MKTLNDYLSHLEKLEKKISTGPWKVSKHGFHVDVPINEFNNSSGKYGLGFGAYTLHKESDSAFIAESRTAIPILIKMVRGLIDQRNYFLHKREEMQAADAELLKIAKGE